MVRSSLVIWTAGLTLGFGLMIGCSESAATDAIRGRTTTGQTQITGPFGDTEALAFLTTECGACHGVGADGEPGPNAVQWALPQELTRAWLESSGNTGDVYQTLLLAQQHEVGGFPVAMPPAALADDAKQANVGRMLDWMRLTQPLAVLSANELYGNAADPTAPDVSYACAKTSTLRHFLSTFTLAAYDRPPTPDELAAFPEASLDRALTPDARQRIVSGIDDPEHRSEFIEHGLKHLATAIGGAPNIAPGGAVTADIAVELETEFEALVEDRWTTAKYRDLFHDDTVMVSAKTAPIYGCDPPTSMAPDARVACTMTAPRHGFFSTLGFLNSKQSSFLITNNNYGRVAFLYFTLFGDLPAAATTGPTGATANALPSCLEATDSRSLVGAAFGTHAIPQSGAFCQSCHLYKGLAAGSILFRPFSTRGLIYSATDLAAGTAGPGDEDFIRTNALLADQTLDNGTNTLVDDAFLAGLVTSSLEAPKSCLPTGNPNQPFANFANLGELTDFLLARTVSVAIGFTKHAHRTFANSGTPSAEMTLKVYAALQAGGTLHDLALAYFNSDSFACDGAP